jgi:hypothetical protein
MNNTGYTKSINSSKLDIKEKESKRAGVPKHCHDQKTTR